MEVGGALAREGLNAKLRSLGCIEWAGGGHRQCLQGGDRGCAVGRKVVSGSKMRTEAGDGRPGEMEPGRSTGATGKGVEGAGHRDPGPGRQGRVPRLVNQQALGGRCVDREEQ